MSDNKTVLVRDGKHYRIELLNGTMGPAVVFLCPTCQSPDVEGTAWIHLNTERVTDGAPLEDYWCPTCGDTCKHVLRVSVVTGEAEQGEGNFDAAVVAYLKREGWR